MALDLDVSPLKRFIEGVAGDPSPEILLWQVGVAACAIALGFFTARIVCRQIQPSPRWKFGEGDFERVAYPLFTWIYLVAGKLILQQYQRNALLEILQSLLVAWIVIRLAVYVLGHVLPQGGFLRGSIRTIALVAWLGVALHITGLLPGVVDTLEDIGITVGKDQQRITLWLVMQAIAALALTITVAAWISRITESRVMAAEHMEMSTRVVITKVVSAATLFLAILVALPMVGIDITALSIFSGALGVGLGFGLQKIASNYVSGFIVLLDRSLRIGDVITVAGHKGEVRAIESRYTVIRGGDGVETIVPNEKLITEVVSHHTFSDPTVSSVIPVVVPFEADIGKACSILVEAARRREGILADPAPVARVRMLRSHGIELTLTAWIRLGEVNENDLRSELYKDILASLRAAAIPLATGGLDGPWIATAATQNPHGESTA
jgi:small-conductance mechanosensitive channel